ncbi:MAG: hypothetical protein HYU69_08260 [Bacteroidetes bacterium]|nr:hypothetical protein [Bacteroidota bacterium]
MNLFDEEILSFLAILNQYNVRYILVGGLAVNYYGYSRATGDVDIWVDDSITNREQLVNALKAFGVEGAEAFLTYPLMAGYAEILLDSGIYIDLMADMVLLKQVDFAECYQLSESFSINETASVKVLHINKLIDEKERSDRSKDRDDAEKLRKLRTKK